MQEYKVTFTCADCDNIDYYPINKYECTFYRTNNYNKKTCSKCNSNRYESLGCSMIKLDSELLDIWSKDSSLYFLEQDEELIIAEKEYIDLIFFFIDSDATLLYKKAVLLESLFVLIYDMHEGIKDDDELILNKIKEFLLARIHLIDQFDYLIWDYIKEIVYTELGIKARMMKIKVCGMKIPENISELSRLPINFMGLIFYPKSPRYIDNLDPKVLDKLPTEVNRVGVFVNEDIEVVLKQIEKYNLAYVQLHGQESVEYCSEISNRSKAKLIKAFNVATSDDLRQTEDYEDTCDFFLFDTKTSQYGGSGLKFDWSILDTYMGKIPFFLSGGITIDDVQTIKMINHPKLQALDINSKFELEAGHKDIQLIDKFIKTLRYE